MKNFKLLFLVIVTAVFGLSMNACSKKKSSSVNTPYYPGYTVGPNGQIISGQVGGGGNLGVGGAAAPDGSFIELYFSGQNNGPVYVSGNLYISAQAQSFGCGVQPGVYPLQTQQPGQFVNGDFQNIRLVAQNGMPVTIQFGWFGNQYINTPSGQQVSRLMVMADIPYCQTAFN